MKTLNKLKLLVNVLVVTCALSLQAATPGQVASSSPDDIRDGVVNVIDAKQIADLLVWARSSKTDLEDGLKLISGLSRSERHQALKDLITDVVGSSGDVTTELLMRSVLRRAKNLDEILTQAVKNPERETLAIRLLTDSANWAVKLYQSDEDFLKRASDKNTGKGVPVDLDFASLGINHGRYILDNLWLSPSLVTRIELVKESLSYFYNDLNRDNVARRDTSIANVLMKVANFAQKMGLDKSTAEYMKSIEGLSDLEKQNLTRKIETFYKEQLDKASSVHINRVSSQIGVPGSGTPSSVGGFSSDSIQNASFVYVAPGEFLMGSPDNEVGRSDNEQQHEVTLTKGFYMQMTDVTQRQWYDIMGNNPSKFTSSSDCPDRTTVYGTPMCPNNPVEQVSWDDVQDFIVRLNQKVGAQIYRLPTEAEWEYAARAGTTTSYSFGEDTSLLGDYAWYDQNSGDRTHPVCTRKPNPLGLCDMHGNVWQWVQDSYNAEYGSSPVTDPPGRIGSARVLRGGSWFSFAQNLRSSQRNYVAPDGRYFDVGFRLVRTAP